MSLRGFKQKKETSCNVQLFHLFNRRSFIFLILLPSSSSSSQFCNILQVSLSRHLTARTSVFTHFPCLLSQWGRARVSSLRYLQMHLMVSASSCSIVLSTNFQSSLSFSLSLSLCISHRCFLLASLILFICIYLIVCHFRYLLLRLCSSSRVEREAIMEGEVWSDGGDG